MGETMNGSINETWTNIDLIMGHYLIPSIRRVDIVSTWCTAAMRYLRSDYDCEDITNSNGVW